MTTQPSPLIPSGLSEQDRDTLLQTARRLLAETQALSSRIAAVNEIATAINRALDLDEILRVVGKQAKWLLDFNHCSVCLTQPDGSWRVVTLFGPPVEMVEPVVTPNDPLDRALKSGTPQLLAQGAAVSFLRPYASTIILPLISSQQTLGTINFASSTDRPYTQEDMRIGYLLALQLSTAILNATRFSEAEQRIRIIQELNTLSRQLSSAVELNHLVYLLGRYFIQQRGFASFSLGLFEGSTLLLPAHTRIAADRKPLPTADLSWELPLVRHLMEYQTPFQERGEAGWTISLPLVNQQGALHGAILLERGGERPLGEEHLLLLQSLADEVAILMTNIDLYQQVQRLLHTYMPGTVVSSLLANPTLSDLGGREQHVTILFADLMGFTHFSEAHRPQEVLEMLNRCFQLATEAVLAEGGIVDKFLGDGVMALFNTPTSLPDHAGAAIRAARRLQAAIASQSNLRGHRFDIGIHTGTAIVGNVGSTQQRNYTAIGDAVNTAKRLEESARGGQIVVSAATLEASAKRFPTRPLGQVSLKGKSEAIQAFEVLQERVVVEG